MASTETKLDNFLSHRPDAQELVEKNILKDPKVAPALQQHLEDLEKARLQDALRHKIEHRPTRDELVEQHILEPKNEEAFKKAHDVLETKISERPNPETLLEQGILTPQDMATQD
ncbi:hypothetical protein BX666DRAFT_1969471 [Dichotomocladium elegans]|nr:hypothetical protein BX666DRAFT_1969471 [Dichotomocladium elegans]